MNGVQKQTHSTHRQPETGNFKFMHNETLEFFKLDTTDRKVLFWLMDNVPDKSLRSWMEFVAEEYRSRNVFIDVEKLYREVRESINNAQWTIGNFVALLLGF